MSRILFIIGTRPELIKVAPVIHELQRRNYTDFEVLNTAQHKDLLDPYWGVFNIQPNQVLDVMQAGQSLTTLSARALTQIESFIDQQDALPALILAQGDTTTVMAAAMVAFYKSIPFAHLEAGLRSFDFQNPFPEEYNRRIAGISTALHLAPTETSRQNLLREQVDDSKIKVVGNTVVDALEYIRQSAQFAAASFNRPVLNTLPTRKLVLLTCHRRENHGENLQEILRAVFDLATKHSDYTFVWALHPNPNVKDVVLQSKLSTLTNVCLTDPLDYWDLLKLMQRSSAIISDSGGIQEEAPSFGVPVLVLREKTERPEGVDAGVAWLVGANYTAITETFERVLNQNNKLSKSPYGDGFAAQKIVDAMLDLINKNS